ncbi:MAG: hypothetical protein WB711_02985 [Terriglobales bacterium]
MTIESGALSSCFFIPTAWRADWEWGVPLILLTVVIHVLGLRLVNVKGVNLYTHERGRHHPTGVFALVISGVILFATVLHAVEAGLWAGCYKFLGAQPDFKSAMLYSLGAMTTYGSGLRLDDHWRLMGAIEALSGWLLFGLTTAFLYSAIQRCFQIEADSDEARSKATSHV